MSALLKVYYADPERLGTFRSIPCEDVPEPYRGLLAHNGHMTVTVEAYHRQSVDVTVLRSSRSASCYCREILLKTKGTGRVVQYGIVRLNPDLVAPGPREEILQERKPLGRVLIEHDVLREIELFELFQVHCGPVLATFFDAHEGGITYGRTAMIYCDNEPAIELLEIVAPV